MTPAKLSRRALLGAVALVAAAAPVRARVSFLPANASPVLLLMDGDTLTAAHLARIRALDYSFEPDVMADCSATEYGLLVSRIRLAPRVVAVLDPADHALVLQALRDAAYDLEFDGPLRGANRCAGSWMPMQATDPCRRWWRGVASETNSGIPARPHERKTR